MKINTTIDCIEPNSFELMLMAVIRGVLVDCSKNWNTIENEKLLKPHMTIKFTDGGDRRLVTIKIEHTTKAVFREVQKLIEPFMFGQKIQGGWHEDFSTAFVFQRFEIRRETLSYYITR